MTNSGKTHFVLNLLEKEYKNKLYTTIRQLNISKEQFKDFVKYEILYENIPEGYEKIMENLVIKLYRDNGVNLWNEMYGLKEPEDYKVVYNKYKDKIIKRVKQYYEENREKILEKFHFILEDYFPIENFPIR